MPRFQPIELVKPFLIIFISSILCNQNYQNIFFKYSFSFLITLGVALLLAVQPDIGQTLLVFFSWSILIFTSGINIIFLTILFLSLVLIFLYLIFFVSKFEYIKNRLFSFLDSEAGTYNFQSDKALESITSGGFFGKGIGEGTLKNRVPSPYRLYYFSDFRRVWCDCHNFNFIIVFNLYLFSLQKSLF